MNFVWKFNYIISKIKMVEMYVSVFKAGSTYLFEVLPWKCLSWNYPFYNPILHQQGWKLVAQQIVPTHKVIYFSVTESKFIVCIYSFSGPSSIYLLKFSNYNSRTHMFKINNRNTIFVFTFKHIWHVVQVFLLMTLYR